MSVERFRLKHASPSQGANMEKDSNGRWVSYLDYANLKAENELLANVLKPFAQIADMEERAGPADSVMVNVARCREARAALSRARGEKP